MIMLSVCSWLMVYTCWPDNTLIHIKANKLVLFVCICTGGCRGRVPYGDGNIWLKTSGFCWHYSRSVLGDRLLFDGLAWMAYTWLETSADCLCCGLCIWNIRFCVSLNQVYFGAIVIVRFTQCMQLYIHGYRSVVVWCRSALPIFSRVTSLVLRHRGMSVK